MLIKNRIQQALQEGTLKRLALIRILVGGTLMLGLPFEDLQILAEFSDETRRPSGIMIAFAATPLHPLLLSSPHLLLGLQVICFLCLLAVTLGVLTRPAMVASLVLELLIGGLLREHSIFYHSEQLPILLLGILLFTPCAAVWSLDARSRQHVPPDSLRDQGSWAVFLIWGSMAVAYWSAGLSKVLGAGWSWFDADGLRVRMLVGALDPIEYGFGWALWLSQQSDLVLVVLAWGVFLLELAAPLLLFSRDARRFLPLGYLAFHLAVFGLQNILFLELMILQLVFMSWPRLPERPAVSLPRNSWRLPMTFAAASIVGATLLLTLAQRDFYPFSAYKMYARPVGFPLRHSQVVDRDGQVVTRVSRLQGRKQLGLYIARAGKECVALQRRQACESMRRVVRMQLEKSGDAPPPYRLRVLSRQKDGSDILMGELAL